MALQLFGVTAESVRSHHFPNADAWTASSRPSEAASGEAIAEAAGRLGAALRAANTTVEDDANTEAFVSCRQQLRMMVALRIARDMTGVDPEVAKAWRAEVSEWFEGVDESNADWLGEGATVGASEPDGPTDHISELLIDDGSDEDASDAIPVLRRKDEL
jgi:hypothetical protein